MWSLNQNKLAIVNVVHTLRRLDRLLGFFLGLVGWAFGHGCGKYKHQFVLKTATCKYPVMQTSATLTVGSSILIDQVSANEYRRSAC